MTIQGMAQAAPWTRSGVWRGRDAPTVAPGLSTGYAVLDQVLPMQGWPRGGLIEILGDFSMASGLRLLLPALARLSQARRWLAWVAPPHIPYAPALAAQGVDLSHMLLIHPRRSLDSLWVAEQALRSDTCNAVLLWSDTANAQHLRRLQLAAEGKGAIGVVFRPAHVADQASPAALRMHVAPAHDGVSVDILKCRGTWRAGTLHVDWHDVMAGPLSPATSSGDYHTRRHA